jgi:hypothetical protein
MRRIAGISPLNMSTPHLPQFRNIWAEPLRLELVKRTLDINDLLGDE